MSAGVVEWYTPVASCSPRFALADPWVTEHVTVGDLYSHRSGLPAAAGDDLEDVGYDRDYVLSHLVYEPLDPFREVYNYANFGMTAGAEAVAAAAGSSWEDLAERELYEPLGMTSTSARYEDFLAAATERRSTPRSATRSRRCTSATPTPSRRPVASPPTSTIWPSGCS